jgi:hypothetical protein
MIAVPPTIPSCRARIRDICTGGVPRCQPPPAAHRGIDVQHADHEQGQRDGRQENIDEWCHASNAGPSPRSLASGRLASRGRRFRRSENDAASGGGGSAAHGSPGASYNWLP